MQTHLHRPTPGRRGAASERAAPCRGIAWQRVGCVAVLVATMLAAGQASAAQPPAEHVHDVESFMTRATGVGVDRYNDLHKGELIGALVRATSESASIQWYQIGAGTDSLYAIQAAHLDPLDPSRPEMWMSTRASRADLVIRILTGSSTALGGSFFLTDASGHVDNQGSVQVTAWDANGVQLGRMDITGGQDGRFDGLLLHDLSARLDTVRIQVTGSALTDAYATVDDLHLGIATPVPEPAAAGLWILGLMTLGLRAARLDPREPHYDGTER